MRILVINLDRDVARWHHMQAELRKLGLEGERFPAFLGLGIPDAWKPYFLNDSGDIASFMTTAEVGCYASHLAAMSEALRSSPDEPICILEDDLRLTPQFGEALKELSNMPEDWEVLRLSNPAKSSYIVDQKLAHVGDIVRYWRVPNTAGAYVVNQRGAHKFVTYQRLRKRPVDEDLRRPWEHGAKTYGVLPAPATPNIFESSIDEIGGERRLPARKRFTDAPDHKTLKWRYLRQEFGVIGCLKLQGQAFIK